MKKLIPLLLLLSSCLKPHVDIYAPNTDGIIFSHHPCVDENCTACEEVSKMGNYATYTLTAENVNQFKQYAVLIKQAENVDLWSEFYAMRGQIYNYKDGTKIQKNKILCNRDTYSPGEILEVFLASTDGKTAAKTTIIPLPLEITGKDGAKVSITISDVPSAVFSIVMTGFKPFEVVQMKSTSCHESINTTLEAMKDGRIACIFQPAVIGKKGGRVTLDLIRKSENETFHFEFPWGMQLPAEKTLHSVCLK